MLSRRFFFIAVLTAILILFVSFHWGEPTLKVSPESLVSMMDTGEIPPIIDVRMKFEYNKGHIPYALNVPVLDLIFQHKNIAVSQKNHVILYCGSGFRARIAASYLGMVGYKSIYILEGQFQGWKKSGYPVTVEA